MSISLPSKKITVVDAPEVETFDANFIYSFFSKDERTNDTGSTTPENLTKIPSENFDTKFLDTSNFKNRVPRMTKFSWKPVVKINQKNIVQNFYYERVVQNKISIKNNFSKIQSELDFTEDDYLKIEIQDNGIDDKMNFFVRQILNSLKTNFGNDQESFLDVAKTLNTLTNKNIDGNFLTQILYDLKSYGINFIDDSNREIVEKKIIDKLKLVKSNMKINKKLINLAALSVFENSNSVYQDETKKTLLDFEQMQNSAKESRDSSIIDENEYDINIENYISARNIDAIFEAVSIPIGYIISKTEILTDGTRIQKDPIIVENPNSSTTIDFKIKYGSKYEYSIKTVCYIETSALEEETGDLVALSYLISSQDSKLIEVNCLEEVPPPVPNDFNLIWDYKNQNIMLMWSFPYNSQQDIKYFQIFRRSTINEPFQMLKMYDFDDSEVLSPYYETPEFSLIEELDSPKTYYIDHDFKKESKFIYAICSIDAHGMSSGYSIQFEVSFDRFKNKLNKKLISVSGAPKSYPNMYLNTDTFVDTIKDSGHKRLKVVFNPEYLMLTDNKNNNLNLLKTKSDSSYRIQMINVDLQKQENVEITLSDRRTTQEIDKLNNKGISK